MGRFTAMSDVDYYGADDRRHPCATPHCDQDVDMDSEDFCYDCRIERLRFNGDEWRRSLTKTREVA